MEGVRISRSCFVPARELKFRFSKAGGPGGQNVNKRETQVELVFDVARSPSLGPVQRQRALDRLRSRLDDDGVLHVVASEQRTQGRNRDIALDRFRELMSEALRPPPPKRRKTKPSKAATERRLAEKRRRSRTKRDRAPLIDD